jgi:hypothetical protein
VRKSDLFLACEMKVNAAFSDSDFLGEVVDRHLSIPKPAEQKIGGVEYCFSRRFWLE